MVPGGTEAAAFSRLRNRQSWRLHGSYLHVDALRPASSAYRLQHVTSRYAIKDVGISELLCRALIRRVC